jgi:plastocyanin
MFTFCRNGLTAFAAIACFAVGPATAQSTSTSATVPAMDHEVIIVDGAYFPPLIYAQVGDRLVFVNLSSGVHTVQSPAEEWTSGAIPINGTFTLTLAAETPLSFNASVETEGSSAEAGDVVLEQVGEITYEPAPVDG